MIARRVVELHGGTLSVKSEVGEGTRFVLSLPERAPAEPEPAKKGKKRRKRRFGAKKDESPAKPQRPPKEDESQPIGS